MNERRGGWKEERMNERKRMKERKDGKWMEIGWKKKNLKPKI